MSEVAASVAAGPAGKPEGGKWPGVEAGSASPPPAQLIEAALANAAARAAASNARRDLVEYLRLRRKRG